MFIKAHRFYLILFSLLFPLSMESRALLLPSVKTIYTSTLDAWDPSTLEQIVNQCKEGTTIVFDADFDYTTDRCISPKVSITINGCGKVLRTINKYNYVISLFDIQDVESFKIKNLIIDGGYSTSNPDKTVPKEFFITVKNVNNVSISGCTFQNIRTEYPNWKEGDQPYTIWVENYNKFSFCDNVVSNCACPEFLKAVLPIENTNPNRIADISRNTMSFVYTSSAIEVRFGRFRINENKIGVTQGSSINAFGFDSELIGNIFEGSHNSASIDLSEDFFFKYVSHDILVKDNFSKYSRDGLLIADHVNNIKIKNNEYRADIYNKEAHERYNQLWSYVERRSDFGVRLEHDISNISIVSNTFIGCRALTSFVSLGKKDNIVIAKNYIECIPETERSSIVVSQINGMTIKNNVFVNTGNTLDYLENPQFIVIGPTGSPNSSERYINHLRIFRNKFSFSDNETKEAYILAHSLYDKSNCNTLSTLDNIKVIRNHASFKGDILLVSDDFKKPQSARITLSNNSFQNGLLLGNVVNNPSYGMILRSNLLEANTVLEKGGKKYYVIVGGKTSAKDVDYFDEGYIRDGDAILRMISD